MKTIAVTIDEATLRAIDKLARARNKTGGQAARTSRSAIVRAALRRYVDAQEREAREARERRIFARHREKLARQAKALIREQASL